MKFESLSPNVIVDNVNAAVDYYTDKLGFTFKGSVPEAGQYNWAMVQRDDVTIMFQSLKSLKEDLPELGINEKGSIGTFFIQMKGVSELYNDVQKRGVDMVSEMRTTFYGMKEFTIKDLNGYFLTFAEPVK